MKHYSLLELNQEISEVLNNHLEPSYWVIAEISQVQVNQKGHCYLELVEKENNSLLAKMRGTIWSYTYRNLITWFEKMTQQTLKPGMKILFNAVVQYHELYGLSLNIRDIDANFTLGERALRKVEIIEKLKEEGVFEMNKNLSLPLVPQRVAIISSPTAAGFGDFRDQLHHNSYQYQFHTQLFPAVMQGQEAETSIIAAMHQIFSSVNDFDLLVMIRGGGASVDLDCFDSYELSAHVAQFPLPVITGIGHDRDETICDLVAHTKLKTPTAVSEFLVTGMRNYEEKIDDLFYSIYQAVNLRLNEESLFIERIIHQMERSFHQSANKHLKKLDQLIASMNHSVYNCLNRESKQLDRFNENLKLKAPKLIKSQSDKLHHFQKFLEAVDPEKTLRRGFSISKINGVSLKNYSKQIKKGDVLETIADNLTLHSEINQIEKKR